MNSLRIDTNGTTLQVHEHSRAGESVLFLHPGNGSSCVWDRVTPAFVDEYHVITADLRGHGESAIATSGYSMENQACDLLALFDALGIDAAHIVGNSLGTDVAVHFAAMFPERVKSLVNIDAGMINFCGPNSENEATREELIEYRRNRPLATFASREEFLAFTTEKWQVLGEEYARYLGAHLPLRVLEDGRLTYDLPTEIGVQLYEAWCDIRFEDCYPRIECPVLFMPAENWGKLEEKLAVVKELKETLPYVETVIIPGSTHMPMHDHPEAVIQAIRTFLSNIKNKISTK